MGLARFPRLTARLEEPGRSQVWFGWAMALLSTLAFSIAPTIGRGAILNGVDPTQLVAARMVLASGLLGGTILLTTPGRLRLERRGWLLAVGSGMINGVGFLAFFLSLDRLEASIASMLFSVSPLAVLALLALRGEPITRRHAVRLALGLGGIYLLIGPSGQVDMGGVLLVALTVVSFSLQLVMLQWYLQDYDARAITFYTIVGITIVTVAGWLLFSRGWQDPGGQGWLAILVLALVSTFLARLALFGAVRSLGSGQMALLTPLETMLTVIWSLLFLGERLTLWQWLGGLAILTSVLLAGQRLRRMRGRPRMRLWPRP
jgi:drug/metabolite transporter (DMT)-like permease